MSTVALTLENANVSAWTRTTLGEVCQINPGKPKSDALPADAPVTFVPMAAVDDVTGTIATPEKREFARVRGSYTAFQEGDVLFAKITPCMENGKAAIARDLVNGLGFGSSEFHVLRPSDKVLPEFIYQLIRQKSFRAEAKDNMTGSVGQARVPTEWLRNFELDLPPVETQREIVGLIYRLQEQMESTSDRLATIPALLKKFRQSVLAAACSGQLTADWRVPNSPKDTGRALLEDLLRRRSEVVKAKKGMAGVYEEPFEVPASWEWATLEQLSLLITDGEHQTPKYTESGIPFIMIRDLTSTSEIDFTNTSFVSEADYQTHCKRVKPQRGDLLMTKVGTIGVIREVKTDRPFSLFVSVALIRLIDPVMNDYVKLALQAPNVQDRMVGTGTGRTNYVLRDIRALHVPLPPRSEQAEIVRRVESLFALADSIESRLAEATAQVERTTQAILAKAFRGEL